jgi:hypothetical protein
VHKSTPAWMQGKGFGFKNLQGNAQVSPDGGMSG